MGGWSWDRMKPFLAGSGLVHAPTLSGLDVATDPDPASVGLEDHVASIVALIDDLTARSVVLVGHSYGAVVATDVAVRRAERVAGLVIVDGFIAAAGRSILDLHPEIASLLVSLVDPARPGLIQPPPTEMLVAPGETLPGWAKSRLAAMPLATHSEPVRCSTADLRCPVAYLACFRFAPLAPVHAQARRLGWDVHDIDAGHLAPLTSPAEVARAVAESIKRMER